MRFRGNHRDRWMISYADFVTILFAAFVLLYASARSKERIAVHALVKPALVPVPATPKSPPPPQLLIDLHRILSPEQANGLLRFSTEPRGITITLNESGCFRPGKADIQPDAVPAFEKIAAILSGYKNHILLEGHTDSLPIRNNRFRSNWELSMARSISVMQLMERSSSLPPERFSIGGSADNAPKSSNDTPDGRAQNRRVDIIVLDSPSPGLTLSSMALPQETPVSLP